jgi:hypothetical protein
VDSPKPNDLLHDKLCAEMDAFVDGLKEKSKEDILVVAFEKSWKEEILTIFETSFYSDTECAALLETDNLLDALYREWLDVDTDYLVDLRDCVNGVAARAAGETAKTQDIEEVTDTADIIPETIFVPQDYGSPQQTEVFASVINGKLYVGDWVIVKPDEDYGCLIGQVTAIDKFGTPEHDTDNQGDDIHVNLIAADYREHRLTEIAEDIGKLYGVPKHIDELPLDDVIMAPDMLISLAGVDLDRNNQILASCAEAAEFGNALHRRYFDEAETELIDRVEENHAEYLNSLAGFGASELIDMAATIHAYSDAYSYMTAWHGYSDDEVLFYLQFQNPLEIVAEKWRERNVDLDEMRFTMDFIAEPERKAALLIEYPRFVDVKPIPADETPEAAPPAPQMSKPAQEKHTPLNKKVSVLGRIAANSEKVKAYKEQKAAEPKPIKTNKDKERD